MARWVTFDCYGTLIDWNGGISATLHRLWPDEDAAALLAAYHRLEPVVERTHPALRYRDVMALCLRGLAMARGLPLADWEVGALGDALPDWTAFPEVPAALEEIRRRGWSIAILSNTDADLLDASLRRIGVPVDARVIASEIGSYKPAPGHWRAFHDRTGASPDAHVHVGASLYHDIRPAASLGLPTIWIDRLGEPADPLPTRTLPDLAALPQTLDALLP